MRVLALDAMGVIYQAGDDVAELLIPFVRCRSDATEAQIKALYLQCSLGKFSAASFWQQLGLSPAVEHEYLRQHLLVDGVGEFILQAREAFDSIWCLSNDVSEWSRKLRAMFELEDLFDGFVISGDVQLRKPSAAIYRRFCQIAGARVEEVLFIDDRLKNVTAAIDCGMQSILFGEQMNSVPEVRHALTYTDLARHVLNPARQE